MKLEASNIERAEISEMKTEQQKKKKISKTESWFFEKYQ